MANVTSTEPTSRRGYLSQTELAQYANIVVSDTDEADDVIGQAEEMIDAYIGFQDRFISQPINGRLASSGSTTTHTLQSSQQNSAQADYYKGCEMEIIGGTGIGQRRRITASTYAGVLTTDAFTTALDSTSVYKIYQLGKFPRKEDIFYDGNNSPNTYYKSIPEAVKRAVAAQVDYIIQMGDSFFQTDKADFDSESIGDYSYSKGSNVGMAHTDKLIAPKARTLLKGITNRKGVMIA